MKKIFIVFVVSFWFTKVYAQQPVTDSKEMFFVNQFKSIIKLYSNKEELDKTFNTNLKGWLANHKLDDEGKFYVTDYLYFYHAYIGRWSRKDVNYSLNKMKKFSTLIKKHLSDLLIVKYEDDDKLILNLKAGGSVSFHATFEIEPDGALGLMIMY